MLKKIVLLMIFAVCGFILNAQKTSLIRAGYNLSLFYDKEPSFDYRYGPPKFESKPAYYFGLTYYKRKHKFFHFESSIDLTAKYISLYFKSGGLGGWNSTDCYNRLYYADLSYYPVIEIGNRLKLTGSVHPNLGILVYSHSKGTEMYYNRFMTAPESTQINKNGSESYFNFTFDIKYNLRVEYKITSKFGILIEGQYSHSIINLSWFRDPTFGCDGYSAGAGLVFSY